jgi:pimeloyl-ACP methyl ester carboxylesterase
MCASFIVEQSAAALMMTAKEGGNMYGGPLGRRDVLKVGTWLCASAGLGSNRASDAMTVVSELGDILTPGHSPIPVRVHSGRVQIRDVKLWYWDTGGMGVPVILIHPMTGSALVWEYQQPVLAAAGYRVIAYSRRGHHGSDTGSKRHPGTAAGDLHALAKVLDLNKFHLVASAGGAFGALDFAISHPDALASLVLACSSLNIQEMDLADALHRITPAGFAGLGPEFCELGPTYRAADPGGTRRWSELQQISRVADGIEQGYMNRIRWTSLQAMRVPTLLISGDADLYAPPPIMAMSASRIPNCRFAMVDQCGHSAYWERPAQFNELILNFLGLDHKTAV